jgi:hypothetical protein
METKCEFKLVGSLRSKNCIIRNLYYDIEKKQFIINSNNNLYKRFIKDIKWTGRDNPSKVAKDIIIEKLINNDIYDLSFGDNKIILLARRYSPHNAGHLLCETAIPIEYIFNQYGINKENRVIIFDDNSWDDSIYWFEGNGEERRKQCDLFSNNFLKPLGEEVIFGFEEFVKKNNINNRYLRIINNVLFGIGNISPWVNNWNINTISKTLDLYNEKLYNYHSIENKKLDTITFLIKIGRRQVLNYEEVGNVLKEFAKKYDLKYEQFNLENVDFKYQLEVLSRTKILVTNGGSTAFSSFFLNKGTIVLYFPLKGNNFESDLMRKFPDRFIFIDYAKQKVNWEKDIIKDDGSFNVDLNILRKGFNV